MHVQAIDASSINALAHILRASYASGMSETPALAAPLEPAPGQPAGLVAAWREMQACHASVCATLEREMGERHGLGVSDFEVLDRLAENPAREWRAQDLADAVHLSQSALSRLVDRLAKAELVERCACDMDRRGIYVQLTEAGARRHGEASATHRAVLARLLPLRGSAPGGLFGH